MKIAVAIFAYKRYAHLSSLLGSLVANHGIKDLDFFIFIDGPRFKEDETNVNKVIEVSKKFRELIPSLTVHCETKNLGIRKQFEDKGDFIFEKYESAIFLEEDLIVAPNFLKFMQSLLARYQGSGTIGCISGHYVPGNLRTAEYSLCELKYYGHNLAWGTWRNEWSQYRSLTLSDLLPLTKLSRWSMFNRRASYPFSHKLAKELSRDGRSWAIRWYAFFYLKKKSTIFSSTNLAIHTGTDSQATNYKFQSFDPLLTHLDIESDEIDQTILESSFFIDVERKFQEYLMRASGIHWLKIVIKNFVLAFHLQEICDRKEQRLLQKYAN